MVRSGIALVGMFIATASIIFTAAESAGVAESAFPLHDCGHYEDRGDHLILYGGDLSEKFMMMVVLCGAIHGVNSAQGWRVLDIVSRMNPSELIFWYSRFVEAYEKEGLKGVSRVARSMRILYRL
ncbi:MAG: hypothetical protein QXT37_11660 [Thermofilaceae archaeon]